MQINSITYQILGGMYANVANVYAIKARNSLIIVDAAESEHDYHIMQENLRTWGLDTIPISYILVSHKHHGHIGNIWRLKGENTKVVAGLGDSEAIETGDINQIIDYSPYPEHEPYVPCTVDYKVTEGEVLNLDSLKVTCINTPGHTKGSTAYAMTIDGKNILFTGDILSISQEGREVSLGWEGGVDFDTNVYWASLQKLAKVPCDQILPGHGQLCLNNGGVVLQKAKMAALLKFRQPSVARE